MSPRIKRGHLTTYQSQLLEGTKLIDKPFIHHPYAYMLVQMSKHLV